MLARLLLALVLRRERCKTRAMGRGDGWVLEGGGVRLEMRGDLQDPG